MTILLWVSPSAPRLTVKPEPFGGPPSGARRARDKASRYFLGANNVERHDAGSANMDYVYLPGPVAEQMSCGRHQELSEEPETFGGKYGDWHLTRPLISLAAVRRGLDWTQEVLQAKVMESPLRHRNMTYRTLPAATEISAATLSP